MLQRLIVILFICICHCVALAQSSDGACECSTSFGGMAQGDNYLDLNFSNVQVKEVGGSNYLYFTLSLKCVGNWYAEDGSIHKASRKYLSTLDLRFDFNKAVFGENESVVARIESVDYWTTINDDDEDVSWGDAYVQGPAWTNVAKFGEFLLATLAFSENGEGRYFRLNNTTYSRVGEFRWKLKDGANGNTGVFARIPKPIDYVDNKNGAYPTQSLDCNSTVGFGICQTGESLDVTVGGGTPAPTVKITGPQTLCAGARNTTYTATPDVPATSFAWNVKKGGTDVTSTVIEGSIGNTASVTLNWKPTAPAGAYTVCATATNSTGTGAEASLGVTVNGAPALTLAEKDSKTAVCAGETVNLVATPGLSGYTWYRDGTQIATTGSTNTYAFTNVAAPSSGSQITYKVKAASAAGCEASVELPMIVNPLPPAAITTKIANNASRNPNKYGVGDYISMTATNADVTRYTYSWNNGAVTGTTYNIGSAMADSYNVTLKVTDKNAPFCSSTANVALTKDANCGITNIALSGTDGNRICTDGVCRLTATVTANCDGNTVVGYAWYKGGVRLDSVRVINSQLSHVYTATTSGTYEVRVYTTSGMRTASVTVTSRAYNADKVKATPDRYVAYNGSLWLAADCATAKTWLWEPAALLKTTNQQFVETTPLSAESTFYVYATDQNTCMSMDSTKVHISSDALVVNILPSTRPITICKSGTITLEAQVSGGTGSYSYLWNSDLYTVGSNTEKTTVFRHVLTATTAKRYVEVTDNNTGKTGLAIVDINIASQTEPSLTISGGSPICEGSSLKVTNTTSSTAVSEYTWYVLDKNTGVTTSISKQASTDTIVLGKRGDYRVWVAGKANTCTSDTTSKGVDVKVNGFDLNWQTLPTAYVLGGDVTAEVVASNGNAPYNFTWNSLKAGKPVNAANVNPNMYKVTGASENAYLFKVTAEDRNLCKKTLEKKVTGSGGLVLNLANKGVTQCSGGAVLMEATASGGSNSYNFKWYKANDEANALQTASLTGSSVTNQLVAGNFANGDKIVVKVSDNSSPALVRTDTVVVTSSAALAPVVSAGEDVTIGKGASTILFGEVKSGVVAQWNWSKAADLNSLQEASKQYPQTALLNAPKTYTVYGKDAAGCYSLPDQVVVSVNNSVFTASIEDPGTICIGNTVKLKSSSVGSAITSWQWVDPSGQLSDLTSATPLFKATKAGAVTVYLKAKDNNGILATASRTITVKNATAPILQLSGLDVADAICSTEALTVSSTNGITLGSSTWYLNDMTTPVQSGTSMSYRPRVTTPSALQLKVVATSTMDGCPAQSDIIKSINVYPRPTLAFAASSSPVMVAPGAEVQVTAEVVVKPEDVDPTMNYTYIWKHAGSNSGVSYDDKGTITSTATSAQSLAKLTGGASTATQPYAFQVYTIDGNGCHSDTIKRTIVINDDALFVTLTSKYGDFCDGGGAVLVADVVGVTDAKTYKWYKNDVLIGGATASTLFLAPTLNTTDSYKVEVTVPSSGKSGVSEPLQLVASSKVAPILTTTDLKIPKGTQTALYVSAPAGTTMTSWQWSPADKLVAGESTLQHPYTVNLSVGQKYTVYGVSADNCVTPSADVNVSVMDATKPGTGGGGLPDDNIFAYVYPSSRTICSGNSLDLQTVVWGNPPAATTYEWIPANYLSAANVQNPVFNPDKTAPEGNYSYLVKVVRGNIFTTMARVDIKVVPGTLPVLALDASQTGMACAGSDLTMKVTNSGVTVSKYTWIINGEVDTKVTGNKYTWPSVETATKYHVKVIAETNGNCLSNAIELDSMVKPALKLNPLQLVDSCGQVKLFSDAGAGAKYTWSIVTGGSDLAMTDKTDTIYLKPKAGLANPSVPYEVAVSVSPLGGGCQSKGGIAGKLYFQPTVQLDGWIPTGETTALPYMVVEKGKNPVVTVNTPTYTSTNATEVWSASTSSFTVGKGQVRIDAIQKDDTVKILVKNKETSTCFAKDSMPVYLYPDAPKLMIDTVDKSFVKAALYLKEGIGDYYTIWSRKWDPYCLTNIFTKDQVYVKEPTATKLANSVKLWKEPDMDTLEYYYATAGRTIQGRDWAGKTTSDTVGYYLFDVNINTVLANDNYMAIYFDFAAMNCPTTVEMGARLSKTSASPMFNLTYYNYGQQKTVQTTYVVANPGTSVATAFSLSQDKKAVVIRPATNVPGKFMQYGKLPKVQFDVHRTNSGTNINWGFILPQKAHQLSSFQALVEQAADLGDIAQQIHTWNFGTQKPNMISIVNYKPFGTLPMLRPLMFIKINPKSTVSPSYIWK